VLALASRDGRSSWFLFLPALPGYSSSRIVASSLITVYSGVFQYLQVIGSHKLAAVRGDESSYLNHASKNKALLAIVLSGLSLGFVLRLPQLMHCPAGSRESNRLP